jgi:hypothetical protein
MSWIGTGVAVAGVASAGVSMAGARGAASATKKQTKRFKKYMQAYQGQFQRLNSAAIEDFQRLSADFDPLALQNEFDQLYEAVIQPMETNFRENTLPQIRQSYSGGALGSSMFTGGREYTEAKARADLDMNAALLRYQGREAGIARNFQEYDRRRGDLALQYEMGKEPIQSAMNIERDLYGAETDRIASEAARDQAMASGIRNIGSGLGDIASGFVNRPRDPGPVGPVKTQATFNNFLQNKGYTPSYNLNQYGQQPTKFNL